MPDDTIESNRPSIQQKHDYRELQCSGKRHNADYNKEYKVQSGNVLFFLPLWVTLNNWRKKIMPQRRFATSMRVMV